MDKKIYTGLTIAGSDSSGGAGIQADLKAFQANGVFGMSAVTAVTVQNTKGVTAVENIPPDIVKGQIEAVFDDIEVGAVKIGMLSNIHIIEAVASSLGKIKHPLVVLDPVMISKSGFLLIDDDAIETMKKRLFPLSFIVTPNIHEAARITGLNIENTQEMEKAAKKIYDLGCSNVLVKGGHLKGYDCIDVLFDGDGFSYFPAKRIDTKNTHGTGCTLSSAIAANLSRGFTLKEAVERAKDYITGAIENSLEIGTGCGPTHHFYKYY